MNVEFYTAFGNIQFNFKWEDLPVDFWIEVIRQLESKGGLELTTDQAFHLETWIDSLRDN